MRLRLRPYLHYAKVSGGVYLSGSGSQFVLKGPELLFRIVDVCVPLLEAGSTADELVAALGTERARVAVTQLVTALRNHGLLLDLDALTVAEPAEDVRRGHPETLAYLESVSDDPYRDFAVLRRATVLVDGPPTVVLPAARGLHRAGVGQLVLSGPDRDAVAATADRLGARVLGAAVSPDELSDVDAVLVGAELDSLASQPALCGVPDGTSVAVVLLGTRLVLAGPVLRAGSAAAAMAHWWSRAQTWAVEQPPVARPVADALGAALAANLVFEALTGHGRPGDAHVVSGDELESERVVVRVGEPRVPARNYRLSDVVAEAAPSSAELVTVANRTVSRWTGRFELAEGARLPQLPLALRQVDLHAPSGPAADAGSVVAHAEHQEAATVAVVLAALRDGPSWAAGPAVGSWLLDGVLRLLVDRAVSDDPVGTEQVNPEAERLRRALVDAGVGEPSMSLWRVPGVDWRLARVETAGHAVWGWGPSEAEAVLGALGCALTVLQVRAVHGAVASRCSAVDTGALLRSDGNQLETLRKQVASWAVQHGVEVVGEGAPADPVLGDPGFWHGPVWLEPAAADADE